MKKKKVCLRQIVQLLYSTSLIEKADITCMVNCNLISDITFIINLFRARVAIAQFNLAHAEGMSIFLQSWH